MAENINQTKTLAVKAPSQGRTGQPVDHVLCAVTARAAPTSVTH